MLILIMFLIVNLKYIDNNNILNNSILMYRYKLCILIGLLMKIFNKLMKKIKI